MTRDLDWILFSCVLDLPWWGCVIAATALTHITSFQSRCSCIVIKPIVRSKAHWNATS